MAGSNSKLLKREAVVPVPASRRLSFVLTASVLLVASTTMMDVFLWGVFNEPLRQRRAAATQYELDSLRVHYARLASEAKQLRQRADALGAALYSCEADADNETASAPQFATPCHEGELAIQVEKRGPTLCVPSSELSKLELREARYLHRR